jgi:hypothetical protein
MMHMQLEFSHEYHYPDKPEGITLPAFLSFAGKTISVEAKVDTGATYCLFRREHGVELGLPVEQGLYFVLDTLAGLLEAFGHEVTLQTCGLVFQSTVYFAKQPGLRRNLLGRQGWLRNLRMAVIDYDNLLYLRRYDP